ncbi:MAG: tRNA (N6-threonylcarbamoyladenosine(37)-N6)-methyltransferase TrmO [Oscillospiraceae bacterium]|nr:tRNA (N6-threonylcarbamoyladenosine(37)-N6)-methyltransferase TrmO [Oscillospiraceae bacterium]
MEIFPIAHIQTDFNEKFGIPRQSGKVRELRARIVFEPKYRNPDALRGIEGFSHLWLLFDFSLAHREGFTPTVRPPRLGGNRRIGVFASRSPFRPNNIGLSSVELICVEKNENEGDVLIVSGADLVNGTPIYDIKPYLAYTDSHPNARGGYADEVLGHKLSVTVSNELLRLIPEDKREALISCLSEDPRPSYQGDDKRVYTMNFASMEVSFIVKGKFAEIIEIKK